MNEPTPAREGDALDWLHEQGKRRARSVPEFDLDETLAVVRNATNDQLDITRVAATDHLAATAAPANAPTQVVARLAELLAESGDPEGAARILGSAINVGGQWAIERLASLLADRAYLLEQQGKLEEAAQIHLALAGVARQSAGGN